MKNKIYLLIIILLLFCPHPVYSQVVYESVDNSVYNYLSRIGQKGIIQFDDLIKPLPRTYIAAKLLELDSIKSNLSNLEKEELDLFMKDYYQELSMTYNEKRNETYSNLINYDQIERRRFLIFNSDNFKINASLILGNGFGYRKNSSLTHIWNIYLWIFTKSNSL